MTSISTVLLALTLALPTSADDRATQIPAPATKLLAVAIQTETPPAQPSIRQSAGLPQRAPVARTMAEFWPVFAGFVVTWLVIVVYYLSLGRRISRVADSVTEVGKRSGA